MEATLLIKKIEKLKKDFKSSKKITLLKETLVKNILFTKSLSMWCLAKVPQMPFVLVSFCKIMSRLFKKL
jgi:hypothetical protein